MEERARGCWVLAVHIRGEANVVSDAGARDATFASRWNSDPFKDCVLASLQASCETLLLDGGHLM